MIQFIIVVTSFTYIARSQLCAIWDVALFASNEVNSDDSCPIGYEKCASEGEYCEVPYGTVNTFMGAYYGTNQFWHGKGWTFRGRDSVTGGIDCSWYQYGCDPVPGTTKFCCREKYTPPTCPQLNSDGNNPGRCGPLFGSKRCNKNLASYAVHCNEQNGWCGTTNAHKDMQASDIYDWRPTQCLPADLGECTKILDFKFDDSGSGTAQFPTAVKQITIEYDNDTPQTSNAGNIGSDKCEESTYSTTQTTNYDFSLTVGTSINIFGSTVDVSATVSIGGSNSVTEGSLESNCISTSFQSATCEPYSRCRREITITEVQSQTKSFTATLQCDHGQTVYKGEMTVDGSFDVSYSDYSQPMACDYFTTDYNNRNGKQPFCDQCQSADICDSCEVDYYLLKNGNRYECVSYRGCTFYCGGYTECIAESGREDCFCKTSDASAAQTQCQNHLLGTNRRLLGFV